MNFWHLNSKYMSESKSWYWTYLSSPSSHLGLFWWLKYLAVIKTIWTNLRRYAIWITYLNYTWLYNHSNGRYSFSTKIVFSFLRFVFLQNSVGSCWRMAISTLQVCEWLFWQLRTWSTHKVGHITIFFLFPYILTAWRPKKFLQRYLGIAI